MSEAQVAHLKKLDNGRMTAAVAIRRLLLAAVVLAATVALAHVLRGQLPEQSLMLLFLLAVLLVSITQGFWTGLAMSMAAFVAYNYFFVDPLYTLRVERPEDGLALAVLLAAGAATGLLAGRVRDEAAAANARADMLARLAQFSEQLGQTRTLDDAKCILLEHLAAIEGGEAVLLEPRDGNLEISMTVPAGQSLTSTEREAAARVFRRSAAVSRTHGDDNGNRYDFMLLGKGVGVAGYRPGPAIRHIGPLAGQLRETILRQGNLAMERLVLAEDARRAEEIATRESLRSALLSSLSHDLRTPLATILGGATSLRELGDAMPATGRSELLLAIEQEARRLSGYVENLLAMARLKSGMAVQPVAFDLRDAVWGAAARARRDYPNGAIQVHVEPEDVIVRAEPALIEQAVYNLLDNALKYSPDEPPVDLRIAADNSSVTVSVTDRGSGIDPAALPRIFEPFFRGNDAGVKGSGLGLTIAHAIAELHHGCLVADSPGIGHGATFRLTLPRDEEPAAGG
jgi:two-component system sensor histidine kinase KdpD